MRHQARELEAVRGLRESRDPQRLLGVARAEPAHSRVQLHVQPGGTVRRGKRGGRAGESLPPRDDVRIRLQRQLEVRVSERAHHEDALPDTVTTQVRRLGGRGNREPRAPPATAAAAHAVAPWP